MSNVRVSSKRRATRLWALLVAALLLSASTCSDDGGGRTDGPGRRTKGPAFDRVEREPGVVKGQVLDEQGDPVAGARMRVTGHRKRGATFAQTVETDDAGRYRLEAGPGLFTVQGEATLEFEGEDFILVLHAADGECDEQDATEGTVEHFVLQLTGLETCALGYEEDEPRWYTGGSILLEPYQAGIPLDAELEVVLTPVGRLADGSKGGPVEFQRNGAQLKTQFGPIGKTAFLHDIPLGRYEISGSIRVDGQHRALAFATNFGRSSPALEVTFEAAQFAPYGVQSRSVQVSIAGDDPGPDDPGPDGPTPTEPGQTTTTCFIEQVGPVPC